MAASRNWYGQDAKRCSAVSEYGRAVSRCAASAGWVSGVDPDDPVGGVPPRLPPRPTLGDRAPQGLVELNQVAGPPLGRACGADPSAAAGAPRDRARRCRWPDRRHWRAPARPATRRPRARRAPPGRRSPGCCRSPPASRRARRTTARADAIRRPRCADTRGKCARSPRRRPGTSCSRSSSALAVGDGQRGVQRPAAAVQQQGVLAQPLREDALGQPGHEHDPEPAPRAEAGAPTKTEPWRRRAGSCVSVSSRGVSTSRTSLERDRPDAGERRQLGRARAARARACGARAAPAPRSAVSHSPQGRGAAPSIQRCDHRQREIFEVRQLFAVADDRRHTRRIRVLVAQLAEAQVVLVRKSLQPPLPAVEPLDDVGLDEQLFPAPRGAERAGDDAAAVAFGRRRRLRPSGAGSSARSSARTSPDDRSSVGGDQVSTAGSAPTGCAREGGHRHLAEREVFREAPRRQVLVGTGKQGEERAAGGIGTARAALEPGRHAGARQRVLEQPEVRVRRAQQNGHLVERHAALGFGQHPARDLHRLATFARRGEQRHRVVDRPGRRVVDGEEMLLQARERKRSGRPSTASRGAVSRGASRRRRDVDPQTGEGGQRPPICGRHGDRGAALPGQERGHEALFGDGRNRHVEQHERGLGVERLVLDERGGGRGPQAGARDRAGLRRTRGSDPPAAWRDRLPRGRARPASMAPRRPSAVRRGCARRREGSPASRPPARSSSARPPGRRRTAPGRQRPRRRWRSSASTPAARAGAARGASPAR